MSKMINANELLDIISSLIEKKGINISMMTNKLDIPRSTLYDFLYKDNQTLERIQKLCEYLGIIIKVELA